MKQIDPNRKLNRNVYWYSIPSSKTLCSDSPETKYVLGAVNECSDFFEKSLEGDGWILVDKSGLNKDYISAYGIKWFHARISLLMKALETDVSVLGTNRIGDNW